MNIPKVFFAKLSFLCLFSNFVACVPEEDITAKDFEEGYLDLEGCWVHKGSALVTNKFRQVDEVRLRIDTFNKTTEWFYQWQTEEESCLGLYQSTSFEREVDSLLVLRSVEQGEYCAGETVDIEYLPEKSFKIEKTSSGFRACLGDCLFQSDQLLFESVSCDIDFPLPLVVQEVEIL